MAPLLDRIASHQPCWAIIAPLGAPRWRSGYGFGVALLRHPELTRTLRTVKGLYRLRITGRSVKVRPRARDTPSQFVAPDGSESEEGILGISSIFTAKNLFVFTVWTLAGETLAHRFQHPDQAKLLTV